MLPDEVSREPSATRFCPDTTQPHPGLGAAPVMTNDMSLGEPSGVEQGDDVSRCGSGSIVASPAGSSGSSVATLSRSKRSQPLSVQPTRNGFEGGRLLRKSVQQYPAGASAGPESTTSKRSPGRKK